MGSLFSAPSKAKKKDQLCEQCKNVWPDRTARPEAFRRQYTKFRKEKDERDQTARQRGKAKGEARFLELLEEVRNKDKPNAAAAAPTVVSDAPALFIRS